MSQPPEPPEPEPECDWTMPLSKADLQKAHWESTAAKFPVPLEPQPPSPQKPITKQKQKSTFEEISELVSPAEWAVTYLSYIKSLKHGKKSPKPEPTLPSSFYEPPQPIKWANIDAVPGFVYNKMIRVQSQGNKIFSQPLPLP